MACPRLSGMAFVRLPDLSILVYPQHLSFHVEYMLLKDKRRFLPHKTHSLHVVEVQPAYDLLVWLTSNDEVHSKRTSELPRFPQ